jgi:hypothetical protein
VTETGGIETRPRTGVRTGIVIVVLGTTLSGVGTRSAIDPRTEPRTGTEIAIEKETATGKETSPVTGIGTATGTGIETASGGSEIAIQSRRRSTESYPRKLGSTKKLLLSSSTKVSAPPRSL